MDNKLVQTLRMFCLTSASPCNRKIDEKCLQKVEIHRRRGGSLADHDVQLLTREGAFSHAKFNASDVCMCAGLGMIYWRWLIIHVSHVFFSCSWNRKWRSPHLEDTNWGVFGFTGNFLQSLSVTSVPHPVTPPQYGWTPASGGARLILAPYRSYFTGHRGCHC